MGWSYHLVYIIFVIGIKATSATAALAAIAPHLKEAALRGLVRSAIARALKQLCDPVPNHVTMRAGGTRTPSRYQINFLATIRSGSFGELLQENRPTQTALLLENHGASLREPPPTENTPVNAAAPPVDVDRHPRARHRRLRPRRQTPPRNGPRARGPATRPHRPHADHTRAAPRA